MVIPLYPPQYALTRMVVASFLVIFISFTLLFSYHPPFKTTLSKFSPFPTSRPPYTGAIIYLVWLSHTDKLLESLASVNAYLPLHDPWPIILLYTGDFEEMPVQDDFLASLCEKIGGRSNRSAGDFSDRAELVKLDWVLPEGLPDTMEELNLISPSSWPGMSHTKFFLRFITHSLPLHHFHELPLCCTGYHHMCVFYSTKIFFNPFAVMHTRQHSYGYPGIGNDAPIVTKGLWRFIHNYANSHPEVELQLNASKIWRWPSDNVNPDIMLVSGYYNNFEIVKLEAVRKLEVKEWLYHLTQYPEGFYKWCWGEC